MLTGLLATATLLAPAQPPAPLPAVVTAQPPAPAPAPRPGDPANIPPPTAPVPPPVVGPVTYPTDPRPLAGTAGPNGKVSVVDRHQGPPDNVWFGLDYMRFWLRPVPYAAPLLATGTRAPLIGSEETDLGTANGLRVSGGVWLNECHTFGIGGSGFLLEQRSRTTVVTADTLIRPTVDALTGQPSGVVVAAPGLFTGSTGVSVGSRLSGVDGYVVRNVHYDKNLTFDLLFGGRYLDLDEYLDITQVSTGVNGRPVPFGLDPLTGANQTFTDATVTVNDRFRTRNQFFGGFMGFRTEYRFGPAFLGLASRVGIGNNRQTISTDGSSVVSGPAVQLPVGATALPGGVLVAQGVNLGQTTNNQFAVLTEVGATGGVQFAEWGRFLVGYDFLYLNRVARPGLQVDPVVNGQRIPISNTFTGPPRFGQTPPIRETGGRDDFYAHGIRFGLELMY